MQNTYHSYEGHVENGSQDWDTFEEMHRHWQKTTKIASKNLFSISSIIIINIILFRKLYRMASSQ